MSWPQSTDFPETEERAYGMDLKGNENPRKLTFSYSWFLAKRLPLLWNATSRHPSFTPSIFVFLIFIDILLFSCETKLLTIIWEPQLVESVCLCHKIKKQKHIFRVLISRASLPPFFFFLHLLCFSMLATQLDVGSHCENTHVNDSLAFRPESSYDRQNVQEKF